MSTGIDLTELGALLIVVSMISRRIGLPYTAGLVLAGIALRLPATSQHVLVWGRLRGAVGPALALSVPANVAERGAIVVVTFGVVAFSIFAQGLTMPPMLRR
ncbi:cation:proton antiporter [Sphingomonas sp.]|uniref:cation:proton antiporter domain-containing protein n=1 Tax=Sphingomonas sp. TaxID=28214 RepID=UPI0028AC0876|nr:cation:proton antiporter [Sphingomonas sp.]